MINTILKRLQRIYSDEIANECYKEIIKLIDSYSTHIKPTDYKQSEKDIILIAYGDHVSDRNEKPLITLKRFMDKHCKGLINSVHILPFYPYSSDDGFSIIDYRKVDSHLGDWDNIKDISNDYRVMFDGVINHCSAKSDWFKGYLNNDPRYEDYFHDMDPNADYSEVVRPRTSPLLTEFTDSKGKTRHIWTTFSADQVDLNYSNYKVLLEVLDILFTYTANGATLIRLDAIAFLWKLPGTKSVHLPQTHEIIQLMREVLHHVSPEVIIITETNVPHKENISYFGSGNDEAQMVYNFSLPPLIAWSLYKEDATYFTNWAKGLELPSDKVCFFNFTASHDGIGMRPVSEILSDDEIDELVDLCTSHGGLVSYRDQGKGVKRPYELNCTFKNLLTSSDEPEDLQYKRMLFSQALTLSMPGVPGIYLSSLFAADNDQDAVRKTAVNRSINREKYNINKLEESFSPLQKQYMESYRKLFSIRTSEEAFNPYNLFVFLSNRPQLIILKRFGKQDIFCVYNTSKKDIDLSISDITLEKGTNLLTGEIVDNKVTIEGYGFVWLKSLS